MNESNKNIEDKNSGTTTFQIVTRLSTIAIILFVTAFFTPGFETNNIFTLILFTIILTALDYLIIKFTGLNNNALGKGFVRIYSSCYSFIFNSIFHFRLYNFFNCSNYWCINIWHS